VAQRYWLSWFRLSRVRTKQDERSTLRKEKEEHEEMIRIAVEVRSGTARFRVSVQAQSIERALKIAQMQNPGKDCKVTFPIDAEAFFAKEGNVASTWALGKIVA
jgi:hypothetical protein